MNKYTEYIKDNPNNYWFKKKLYGWGWVPVKWQGWAVIAIFIALITWFATDLDKSAEGTADVVWYLGKIAVSILVLIIVCYKTGEKPKWQWGLPKDKK